MEVSLLDFLIVGSIILFPNLIFDLTYRRVHIKKINYDCSKCKLWDCQYHQCQYLKNKKGVKE